MPETGSGVKPPITQDCHHAPDALCTLLGVEFPILNASMSETAGNGRLAAAVSAGGFGMIGGTSPGGATWLQEQIAVARSLTDKPFGVGFISLLS
ncbi:MAG: nitronate monooxygenase [Thermomicrobiales bacterium]